MNGKIFSILWILFFALAVVTMEGCSPSENPAGRNYVDESITSFTQLGFLHAAGHGADKSIPVPGKKGTGTTLYPGGVVLRRIEEDSPLQTAGLRTGDVIIRVADDYLPEKENPSWDLLKRLESALTAGKKEVEISYLRKGTVKTASLPLDAEKVPPLIPGGFEKSKRYALCAARALDYLKTCQKEDGSFAVNKNTADANLAVVSMAGLAFLAGADLPQGDQYEPALTKCLQRVQKAVEKEEGGPMGAAHALAFLAGWIQKRKDVQAMTPLAQALAAVLSAQQEDGSWRLSPPPEEAALNQRTVATSWCLFALGFAERAGVRMDSKPIEKACSFLKKETNNGNVGYVPDPAFDRRSEAARLVLILAALRALSCPLSDGYMQKLCKYCDELSSRIPFAPVQEAPFLLASALVAKGRGVPGWTRFNGDHGILLLSLQKGDGAFASLPKEKKRKIPFYDDCDGEPWRTAHYALILLLQEDHPPLFAGGDQAGRPKRDSDGKLGEAGKDLEGEEGLPPELSNLPPGGKMKTMQFKSMEEAQEFFKKMGIDSKNLKVIKGKGPAKENEKKKKENK